jgi:hypothetical protein
MTGCIAERICLALCKRTELCARNAGLDLRKTAVTRAIDWDIYLPARLTAECETWSVTLREEHRLKVFENRVQRRIFGLKRDEVTEECRKLHNEEFHNLYPSPSIMRMIK